MTLSTTSESTGKDQVKLTVEVPESELKGAINAVYKRWATEIKVPGFRKGKVPRQMIDARVGPEVIREEALRDALPDLYREALEAEVARGDRSARDRGHRVRARAHRSSSRRPWTSGPRSLPDLLLGQSRGTPDGGHRRGHRRAARTSAGPLRRARDRLARCPARRPSSLIDLKGYKHGEPVEGASAPDYLYEVGSGQGPPSLDEELEGEKAGAILKFTDSVPRRRAEGDSQEDLRSRCSSKRSRRRSFRPSTTSSRKPSASSTRSTT